MPPMGEALARGEGPEAPAHCTIPTIAGSPGLVFYPSFPGPGCLHDSTKHPDVRASMTNHLWVPAR